MDDLAAVYVAQKVVPPKYGDDALHVAVCTVSGINLLVSRSPLEGIPGTDTLVILLLPDSSKRNSRTPRSDQSRIKGEVIERADTDLFEVGMGRIEKVVGFAWDYDARKFQHCRTAPLYPKVTDFLRR
jgi:hypothetical protein